MAKALSRSAKFYRDNPEARKKKAKYDAEFGKDPKERKKRSNNIKVNREADKRGVDRTGKDASHTKNGIVYKDSSVNRGSKTDQAGDRRARGGKKKK